MSHNVAEAVTPHLPYLRRFARALTGSQSRGDAYVVAFLETLVADPSSFRKDLPSREATYRAFLEVLNAVPLNHTAETPMRDEKGVVDRRIETLEPESRQAFLLASLEDFSLVEIAAIMARDEGEVREFIDRAGKEIAEQIASKILIIEDEPLIALDIETLVKEIGHDVVGIASTHKEAVDLASTTKPGLVLADIQLADGSSGIDAVNDILKHFEIPAIFITAYPERLLTGQRAEPTFLITKPFRPEMVKAIISQALFFDVSASVGGGAAV